MKVTFNMATIPSRYELSLKAIDSIYDQADEIRIYLNNFHDVPEELKRDKIITHIGEDLNASGKLFWALNPNEYYFCIDDDLRYPSDYASKLINGLNEYEDNVCVSLHGKILKQTPIDSYFRNGIKESYRCLDTVLDKTQVHVIGNGVSVFNTNKVKIDYNKFKYYHMDDIEVSIQIHQQQIPIIVLPHESNYLRYEEPDNIPGVKTLFSQYWNNDSSQTERVNTINWKLYEI